MQHGSTRAAGDGRRFPVLATLVLLAPLLLTSTGCSSAHTDCTVTSLQNKRCYQQGFSKAYASRDSRGDLNVVLAADVSPAARGADAQATPLRQIMHIRVLWEPGHGMRADQPTSTNASIRWYVFAGSGRAAEMIEYAGTGLAEVDPDGDQTTVEIRNATLNPVNARGLNDPIGSARFKGTVVARTNGRRVSELLAEVKTTLAAASAAARREVSLVGP